jgi:hypothetical protein
MDKKVKKALADLNKRVEKVREQAIKQSATAVKALRRELDKLARRLDAMTKQSAA